MASLAAVERSAAPRRRPKRGKLAWLVPAIVVGSSLPYLVLGWRAWRGALGANPVASALDQLGLLALLFLLASLSCTPLKVLFGWKWPLRIRKTLGLFAFFTALSHFVVYFVVDQGLAVSAIWQDIVKRPFISIGVAGLLLMLPLALTSSKAALKRLGTKRWRLLHRLAYVAAGAGVVHYFLRVKKDISEPLIYGAVLAVLLGVRLVDWVRRRGRRNRPA